MADFDIEDVRLKDIEELSDDEKKFLLENKDNLSDSEQDYFKDAWGDIEEEGEDKKKDKEEEEEKPFKAFKTQEEHDKYIEEELKKRSQKKPTKKTKEDTIFDKGYKPKDWSSLGKDLDQRLYPRFKERMEKERREQEEETKKFIAEQNKRWDEEIEELRSGGEDIPAPGTEERRAFDKAVTQVLIEYNMTSMAKAFDVWKMKGGKVTTKVDESEEEDKEEEKRRMDLASKVGKGRGTKTQTKEKNYANIAGRTMDDIFESAEKRLGG